jgi:hypothetical protein
LVALPKNLLFYAANAEWGHFRKYFKGFIDGLFLKDVKEHPTLNN